MNNPINYEMSGKNYSQSGCQTCQRMYSDAVKSFSAGSHLGEYGDGASSSDEYMKKMPKLNLTKYNFN